MSHDPTFFASAVYTAVDLGVGLTQCRFLSNSKVRRIQNDCIDRDRLRLTIIHLPTMLRLLDLVHQPCLVPRALPSSG